MYHKHIIKDRVVTTKRAKYGKCSKWFPLGSELEVKDGGDSSL